MEGSSSSKSSEGNTKIAWKLVQALQLQKDNDKQAKHYPEALEILEDPEEQSKQCRQANFTEQKPEWLEGFLQKTFFEACPKHPIRRNELNKYCIDCDESLCQYCLSLAPHDEHRLLKIYRHVYKDVVPLDEIERHIDCSQIQPYRCNRQLVIALSPLPHSGTRTNEEVTCQTCNRKLIEYDIYTYCSISCKMEALSKAIEEAAPPPQPLDEPVEKLGEQVEEKPMEQPKSFRTRKRKGIPRRAPFF